MKAETTASAASPLAIAVISAEAGGFKKAEVSFTLSAGEAQGIEVHLAVATAAAAVNVTAEAAPLNMDESRIQATLSADTVRDLPQLNRNIYDVLAVTPGVVGTGTRGPGESPGGGADISAHRHPSSVRTGGATQATGFSLMAWSHSKWQYRVRPGTTWWTPRLEK